MRAADRPCWQVPAAAPCRDNGCRRRKEGVGRKCGRGFRRKEKNFACASSLPLESLSLSCKEFCLARGLQASAYITFLPQILLPPFLPFLPSLFPGHFTVCPIDDDDDDFGASCFRPRSSPAAKQVDLTEVSGLLSAVDQNGGAAPSAKFSRPPSHLGKSASKIRACPLSFLSSGKMAVFRQHELLELDLLEPKSSVGKASFSPCVKLLQLIANVQVLGGLACKLLEPSRVV
jgi:hypothetical protein